MTDKYILDLERNPIKEPNIMKWGRWFKKNERHIGDTKIGDIRISTVFLGLDHQFDIQPGSPVLWETMVFGGELDGEMERYTSLESAKYGHNKMVERVKESVEEGKKKGGEEDGINSKG